MVHESFYPKARSTSQAVSINQSFLKGAAPGAVSRCIQARQGRARKSKDRDDKEESDTREARTATWGKHEQPKKQIDKNRWRFENDEKQEEGSIL